MCEPVGGGEGELQCVGIGDASAEQVGGLESLRFAQGFNLSGGAMDDDDADVQRAQDGDVEEEVGKVLVGDNRAVDGEDEHFFAEARDVLEDAPQVGRFH